MNSSNIIAVSAKMYGGKAQQDGDSRRMAALSLMNNKQKAFLKKCHMTIDPKKGK